MRTPLCFFAGRPVAGSLHCVTFRIIFVASCHSECNEESGWGRHDRLVCHSEEDGTSDVRISIVVDKGTFRPPATLPPARLPRRLRLLGVTVRWSYLPQPDSSFRNAPLRMTDHLPTPHLGTRNGAYNAPHGARFIARQKPLPREGFGVGSELYNGASRSSVVDIGFGLRGRWPSLLRTKNKYLPKKGRYPFLSLEGDSNPRPLHYE